MNKVKRALISVSDKTGIVEFASYLASRDIIILSTGGTASLLTDNGIDVVEVSSHTGFPEIMDGRVKTLHPKIHGGLLGRRGIDNAVMAENNIDSIDLVVVNLYPFEATISKTDCTLADAIENIDIGGPAMLRSAAKNHAYVGAVVDVSDYESIINELDNNEGSLTAETRFVLAQKVFTHTASYDANVSNYLGGITIDDENLDYPLTLSLQFKKLQDLRYGENPHQSAAFYEQTNPPLGTLASAKQLQGKVLSYNNIADTDAALECVLSYQEVACVIVKHTNPCGVAIGENVLQAYERAYQTDPSSAFGGIIAFNHPLDVKTAKAIINRQFVEVIIAPSICQGVLDIVSVKENIRVLEVGTRADAIQQLIMKRVSGGLLIQDSDQGLIKKGDLKIVGKRPPTETEIEDMLFAWKVAKYAKSNAIVYAKDKQTLGIGVGQMSRVYSARIAAIKAEDEGLEVTGSVMASDAFFPFRDGIDSAAKAGVTAIIQPGGSICDEEVIAAADESDIAMVFTSMRHFLH